MFRLEIILQPSFVQQFPAVQRDVLTLTKPVVIRQAHIPIEGFSFFIYR